MPQYTHGIAATLKMSAAFYATRRLLNMATADIAVIIVVAAIIVSAIHCR